MAGTNDHCRSVRQSLYYLIVIQHFLLHVHASSQQRTVQRPDSLFLFLYLPWDVISQPQWKWFSVSTGARNAVIKPAWCNYMMSYGVIVFHAAHIRLPLAQCDSMDNSQGFLKCDNVYSRCHMMQLAHELFRAVFVLSLFPMEQLEQTDIKAMFKLQWPNLHPCS